MFTDQEKRLLLECSKELTKCRNEYGEIFMKIRENNLDFSNVMEAISNSAKAINILEASHTLLIQKLLEQSDKNQDDLK